MISVIFITHNRKSELFRAIESCFKQSYKDIEIIIIDNASDENIADAIEVFMKEHSFHNYRYLYQNKNLGVAGGRNLGFEKSRGEYCFFLDDDAVLTEHSNFERAIADFEKNKNAAAIACQIYQPLDGTYLFSTYINPRMVTTYVGAAHFIKAAFWKNKRLYPHNIMYGSEEMYTSLYIMKNNAVILFDEHLKVNHLPSRINRTKGKERDLNIIINTFICRRYFYPAMLLPILYFTLYLHLVKNKLFEFPKIKKEIRKRYKKEYEDKMTLIQFIKVCNFIKLRNAF